MSNAQVVVPGVFQIPAWREASNIFLVESPEGLLLIDSGMPRGVENVLQTIRSVGHLPGEIEHLVVTHADLDHIGGLAAIKARSRGEVVAHRIDAPIVEGRESRPLPPGPASRFMGLVYGAVTSTVLRLEPTSVERVVENGSGVPGGFRAVHVPGHTLGQIALFGEERGLLFTGDALNNRGGSLGGPPPNFTVDMVQAHDSIRRLAELEVEVCCFGHGAPIRENAVEKLQAFAETL